MTTINGVNLGLSGSTGTGTFVGSTSPTLVTPALGAATATSLVFSPTTSGIIGTTTNDDAAAGKVGEFISSVIPGASSVSLTNNTPANLASISLTAGDWDVWGNTFFDIRGSCTSITGWLSASSATEPDESLVNQFTTTAVQNSGFSVPSQRFSLSTTTTVYISVLSLFSTSTVVVAGGIYARRVR